MVRDATDDCVTAVHGLQPDIQELVSNISKGDYNAAILTLMGKLIPKAQAIQKGGMECLMRVLSEVVGEACMGDVQRLVADIQKFAQTKNVADLLIGIADFQKGMQDCTPKMQTWTTTWTAVDCDAELKAILDAEPTVIDHLKASNFLALIGDLTNLKPHIDNIANSCVKKTDACNALGQKLQGNLNDILADVQGNHDKGTIE
jgi:hypothetical protein